MIFIFRIVHFVSVHFCCSLFATGLRETRKHDAVGEVFFVDQVGHVLAAVWNVLYGNLSMFSTVIFQQLNSNFVLVSPLHGGAASRPSARDVANSLSSA
jgi:hypothetical protein